MPDQAAQLSTDDLEFALPEELIAQHPAPTRGASQLLVCEAGNPRPIDLGTFDELFVEQLVEGDLVVANDSRVLRARVRVERPTGGAGELLLLEELDRPPAGDLDLLADLPGTSRWLAMARPARKFRAGGEVRTVKGDRPVRMLERTGAQTWTVELPVAGAGVPAWLERVGELPLPPYITAAGQSDDRYQTVHARVDGSVAAPTAGLHLSADLWRRVEEVAEVANVTLHVGAGTFLPVAPGPLADHLMHHERFEVAAATDAAVRSALDEGRRVVAIGTTTARTLEHVYGAAASAPDGHGPLAGSTDLFIVPGHEWACVGALLTNFHLPRSTLIALVMAFHGIEETRAAYARAIEGRMRFYSFGDAMFVHGPPAS